MVWLRKHPRRNAILGVYIAAFILTLFIPGAGVGFFLLACVLITAAVIVIFRVDCAAVAANVRYGRAEYEKAERLFKYALSRGTISPQAYLNYAVYRLRRGGAAEAEPLLERALILSKDKILTQKNVRLAQSSCRWALGDTDGSIGILEKMRSDYDYVNANVLSSLAYMYFLKGDSDLAEELSLKAVEDKPECYAAWDNLGQIRLGRGEAREAKDAFNKALEYKKDLPESLYHLGTIAASEGETELARDYLARALACDITSLSTVTREQVEAAASSL